MTCECGAILNVGMVKCPECRVISYKRLMTIEDTPLRVDRDLAELVSEE